MNLLKYLGRELLKFYVLLGTVPMALGFAQFFMIGVDMWWYIFSGDHFYADPNHVPWVIRMLFSSDPVTSFKVGLFMATWMLSLVYLKHDEF